MKGMRKEYERREGVKFMQRTKEKKESEEDTIEIIPH
jgi:hypothetical protein